MEQRTTTCKLVESLTSKMGAHMGAKKLKYVYLNSTVTNKEKWGVDFDKIKVKELISSNGNSLNM